MANNGRLILFVREQAGNVSQRRLRHIQKC